MKREWIGIVEMGEKKRERGRKGKGDRGDKETKETERQREYDAESKKKWSKILADNKNSIIP